MINPESFATIRTVEGITEYRLSNGLTVLFLPDMSAQNVTVNITYLVGSRHESRGEAGMAHLLEHMLFKGTPVHPNITGSLQDRGAFYNASTWYDRTNYFETLSASDDNLEFALKLEADRMINSWIRQEDLDTEMTVVRNEFEMTENNPADVLHNQMFSVAYQWHSYGKSTIGNRSDIERVAISNLKRFYKHYYQPDNAVLIVAGNFNSSKAQQWILQYFGVLPKPDRIVDSSYTEEPTQDGTREVKLMRAGEVAQAAIAYHIPAASHPDFSALLVLSEVLSHEPGGLLFRKFVQTGLTSSIYASAYALKEPGIFLISVQPTHLDQSEVVLNKMIDQLEKHGLADITSDGVERAKKRILKTIKRVMMNSKDFAIGLSESIAQGDYRLFFYTRDQVKTITADDVIRVLTTYFTESNRTAGLFVPSPDVKRSIIPPAPDVAYLLEGYCSSEIIHMGEEFEATTDNIDAHTIRSVLAGTIKTSFLSKSTRGQVNRARMVFHFGSEEILKDKWAALLVIPSILRRGSTSMTLQQVQDTLDNLESSLRISAGQPGIVMVDILSERNHLQDVIALTRDLMQSPSFLQEEFAIAHERELSDLKKMRADPMYMGMRELNRLRNPFTIDSIHYIPTVDEKISALSKVTLDDAKQVYHELYGANHLEVTIVGDFDSSVTSVIESCFGKWHSHVPYSRITKPAVSALGDTRVILTPEKKIAVVAMAANFAMRDDDAHYPAMRMANYIFGESMKSRLVQRLREKEGLSYSSGSYLDVNRHDYSAGIMLYAMCPTDKADFTLHAMQEEYRLWIDKGVTTQELQEFRQSFQLNFRNGLANDAFLLQTLASMIDVNRTFGYYAELLDKLEKLHVDDIHKVLELFLKNATIASVKSGDFSTPGQIT